MTSLCTTFMAMTLAVGSADTPLVEYGNLLVGEWSGQASLIDHAPEGKKQREKVPAILTYRWVTENKVLEGNWQRGDVSGRWLLTWDSKKEVIRTVGGRSDGNAWTGVIVKGQQWVGETTGVLDDGAEVTGRFVSVIQKKKIVVEGEFSINGERQEPLRDVYEKTQTDTPLTEFGDQIVGRWIGDVKLVHDWPGIGKKGEEIVAYWTVEWTADRQALLCKWQGGQGGGTSLFAWNAATNCIMDLTARTDGVTGLATVTKDGDSWRSKAKGALKDGTKAGHNISFAFEEGGKVMRVSGDVIVGGKKVDPLHDVYRKLDE